eukprot:gene9329-17030_t
MDLKVTVITSKSQTEYEFKNTVRTLRKRNTLKNNQHFASKDGVPNEKSKRPRNANDEEELSLGVSSSLPSFVNMRLSVTNYTKNGLELAKYLLGKIIFRRLDTGEIISARIVETEAYLGEVDKACHSFGGKRTDRTEPMYMAPGTAYIYFIYGMYYCLNISSQDVGGCVLIRALEPLTGQKTMRKFRLEKRKSNNTTIKDPALCNGPSKLCTALKITKDGLNKENLASSSKLWIEAEEKECGFETVVSKRIGIDSYGSECSSKLYRFYILGNKCVSIKDKEAEKQ